MKDTTEEFSESKYYEEDGFESGMGAVRRISPTLVQWEPSNSIFYSVFLVLNTMIGSGTLIIHSIAFLFLLF